MTSDPLDPLRSISEQMDTILGPLRGQQEQMDRLLGPAREQQLQMERLLGPTREQHEQALKALAPFKESYDLLGGFTASLAALSPSTNLLRAYEAIRSPQPHDYAAFSAITGPDRNVAAALASIQTQTRWIEDISRLASGRSEEMSVALGALEKLAVTRNRLLDETIWATPRPFNEALTDILYIGRGSWALEYLSRTAPQVHEERIRALIRETGTVIAGFAGLDLPAADLTGITVDEAAEQGRQVVAVLAKRAATPTEGSLVDPAGRGPDPVAAEAHGLMLTIAQVTRLMETKNGRPLGGRYAAWLLEASLEVTDASRGAEDRFDSLVRFLFDVFIDAVNNADQALRNGRPAFFSQVVQDLRHKDVAHAPEASVKPGRIAANLTVRAARLREVAGTVPVTPNEWRDAFLKLLRLAARAAIEFRDRLS